MTQTIHCPQCSVELTIPDEAGTKRLRCPKCSTRFYPTASSEAVPRRSASSGTLPRRPASSILGEETRSHEKPKPKPRRSAPSSGLHQIPRAPAPSAHSLADDASIPLQSLDDLPLSPPSSPILGDAEALFREEPVAPRKKSPAEARREARRCPSCGGFVLGGMSLCERCGLDLDTGTRHQFDDLVEEIPEPVEEVGPPVSVFIIGVTTISASLLLGILSLISFTGLGRFCLTTTCLFGVFASVQFLRGRSWQLLLISLLLGGAVDIIALIVLPIVIVDVAMPAPAIAVDPLDVTAITDIDAATDLDEDVPIRSEKINISKVILGVIILFADAVLVIWMSTPPVLAYFHKKRVNRDAGYVTI